MSRTTRVLLMLGVVGALAAATFAARAAAARPGKRAERPARLPAPEWKLTSSAYSLHKFTFVEAVDKTKELGLKYIEGFSWQKIAPGASAELNAKAPPEAIEIAQKKLKDAGVQLISYYAGDFGNGEADARKVFEFAKKMGAELLVSEPRPEVLGMLDKLAKEYKISVAIHNHPKDPKNPNYENWDPDHVMKVIKGHSERIGCCADTGHWVRSGLDPLESLKKYQGRLLALHLKDVNEPGHAGKDVPAGAGVGEAAAIIHELQREKFAGVIALEYEEHLDNNLPDLKQSIAFIEKTAAEPVKAKKAEKTEKPARPAAK